MAQEKPSPEASGNALLNQLKVPPVEPPKLAPPAQEVAKGVNDNIENSDSRRQDPSAAAKTEPKTNWFIVAFGALCSATAMRWFYVQLKRNETPISVASIGLYALNDGLLSATALATGQGVVGASVMAVFALGGLFCARQAYRQSTAKVTFSPTDKVCAGLCVPGIMILAASKVPAVELLFNRENLAIVSSCIAVAVNTIAAIPLIRSQLAKVEPGEKKLDTSKGRTWATILPALPYCIGSVAMGLSLYTVPSPSFGHLFQPVVLFVTNLVFVSFTCIWASRRLAPQAPAVDPSKST